MDPPEREEPAAHEDGTTSPEVARALRDLDQALTGALPCIVCRYDLQGLSIRSVCPECGTAVRATILHRIDPKAEELRPLATPRLTAASIAVWSIAGFIAVLASWEARVGEVLREYAGISFGTGYGGTVAIIAAGVSGLALFGAVRLVRERTCWRCYAAMGAIIAYVPLIYAMLRIGGLDGMRAAPYSYVSDERLLWRVVLGACIAAILVGFRPNARELVRRCLAMRTGRVDRQTLLSMVIAVLVAMAGDGLRLLSLHVDPRFAETTAGVGTLLVLIGSGFLTLGMFTAIIDSVRIGRVLVSPGPSMSDVLGGQRTG
ncbi:MAG: hypothetical protein AAFX05_12235 [Planctomycetota bacterium]